MDDSRRSSPPTAADPPASETTTNNAAVCASSIIGSHPAQHAESNRRLQFVAIAASVLLAICIAAAPALLIHTPARNILIATAIHGDTLVAVAASADGGWFQPLVFHDLLLLDANGKVSCRVDRAETSKGLLAYLIDSSPLHLAIHDARLKVDLNPDGSWPECGSQGDSDSQLTWSIQNAAFQLNAPWRTLPIVDLQGLHLDGRVGPDTNGHRQLAIESFTVLDRAPVSDNHASQNLALIAPILSRTTRIDGNATVHFEGITVPLDGPAANAPFPVRGRAAFHSLEASLRQDFLGELTHLIPASGLQLPGRIAVLDQTDVRFEVTAEGIHHDGMIVLLPELAQNLQITTKGTIGLDERLDIELTINLPEQLTGATAESTDKPLAALLAGLAKEPLRLHVTGTVSSPVFALPEGMDLAGELLRRVAPDVIDTAPPSVTSAVTGLIRSISNEDKSEGKRKLPGSIINLIRAVDKSAKDRKKQRK
ncbi:MAG: hypothetical protein ACKO2L_18480 [Planctomycetaceae bacterium]